MSYTEISGLWIEGFQFGWADSGAIWVFDCERLHIINNVMINNSGAAIAVGFDYDSSVIIEGNTFVDNKEFTIIGGVQQGRIENNIIMGRLWATISYAPIECNYILDISDVDPYWENYNFTINPQFCGAPGSGNYFLQSDSPCAPGNTPPPLLEDCGLVGALPVGCGMTPVRSATWGELRSLYR